MRDLPLGARLRAAALAVVCFPACTLFTAADSAEQCTADADCADLGVAGAVCDTEAKVCIVPESGTGGSGGSPSVVATSSTSSAGGEAPAGCLSNAECIDDNGQLAYICRKADGACVPLLNEECTQLFGDIEDLRAEDPLILGYMGKYTGEDDEILSAQLVRNGALLAIEEIQDQTQGLPVGAGNARRPLLLVGCDEEGDYMAAASHLVEDIGVPVLFAPESDDKALEVGIDIALPNSVMMMVSTAKGGAIITTDDDGLFWVALYEGRIIPKALSDLMQLQEEATRTLMGVTGEDPLRVAEALRNDSVGIGLGDAFDSTFIFNEKSVSANADENNFLRVGFEDDQDVSDAAVALADFAPHQIVLFGQSEGAQLMQLVEEGWDDANPRPLWFFDENGYDYPVEAAAQTLSEDDPDSTIGDRILGVRPFLPADRAVFDAFKLRYRGRFDNDDPGTNSGPVGYDMTYMVAYAALGAGDVALLDGRAIAAGMSKLVGPGALINVGPTTINQAISALAAGTSIDFQGTLGPYAFDLQSGAAESFHSLWCAQPGSDITFSIDPMSYDPVADEFLTTSPTLCNKWD